MQREGLFAHEGLCPSTQTERVQLCDGLTRPGPAKPMPWQIGWTVWPSHVRAMPVYQCRHCGDFYRRPLRSSTPLEPGTCGPVCSRNMQEFPHTARFPDAGRQEHAA